jgi:hypothetical protein
MARTERLDGAIQIRVTRLVALTKYDDGLGKTSKIYCSNLLALVLIRLIQSPIQKRLVRDPLGYAEFNGFLCSAMSVDATSDSCVGGNFAPHDSIVDNRYFGRMVRRP